MTTETPDRTSVQDALAAVMRDLPGIGKGDTAPEGYSYRGIEAVAKQVQPLFARHGVVVAPRARITDVRPSPAMKDGWTDVFMEVEWTITGPDGSQLVAQTTGIGRDRSDKGANKAQTQAFKYLLLHLLCIADTKDDTDGQSYEHDRQERRPLLHPDAVKRFVTACEDAGVHPEQIVEVATGGRTMNPAEVYGDEADALREAKAAAVARAS